MNASPAPNPSTKIRSNRRRGRVASLLAAVLTVSSSLTLAMAAPASAAPISIQTAADSTYQGCPAGTTGVAGVYNFNPASAGPLVVTDPAGTRVLGVAGPTANDVNQVVSFFGAPIPIIAATLTAYDANTNQVISTGQATFASPVTSDSLSTLVPDVISAGLPSTAKQLNLVFCGVELSVTNSSNSVDGTQFDFGNALPGAVSDPQVVTFTNNTGVDQQVRPAVSTSPFVSKFVRFATPGGGCFGGPAGVAVAPIFVVPSGTSCTLTATLALPPNAATGVTLHEGITFSSNPLVPGLPVPLPPDTVTPVPLQDPYHIFDASVYVVDSNLDAAYSAESSIDFGSAAAGAELPYQIVHLSSSTTTPAAVSLQIEGAWPSLFQVDPTQGSNACSTNATDVIVTVPAAGTSCTVGVRPNPNLSPTDLHDAIVNGNSATINESFQLGTTTAPISTFAGLTKLTWTPVSGTVYANPTSVDLTGVANQPLTIPISVGYVGQVNGQPLNVDPDATTSITGPDAAQFSIDSTCDPSFSNWSCPVTVIATPLAGQVLNATVTVDTIDGAGTPASVSIPITVTAQRPVNDDISNATTVTLGPDGYGDYVAPISGTVTGATTESGEQLTVNGTYPPSNFYPGTGTVWYQFTAPESGWLSLYTSGPNLAYDANLYYDTGGRPASVVGLSSPVAHGAPAYDVIGGQSYWVQVGLSANQFGTGDVLAPGAFDLLIGENNAPPQPSVLDLSTQAVVQPATPPYAYLGASGEAVDPGGSVAFSTQFTVDVTTHVRVQVVGETDQLNFGGTSPAFTVWDVTGTAGPYANPSTSGSPAATEPDTLGFAPVFPVGNSNAYTFLSGHTYAISATNHDTQTLWLDAYVQRSDSTTAPPPAPSAPTFSNVPSPIVTGATDASGAAVWYAVPTAVTQSGVIVTPTCAPSSGSTFSIGVTTVSCSATDPDPTNGLTATTSFTVTVNAVAPAIAPNITSSSANSDASASTVKVAWAPPSWDGGSPITSYTVTAQAGSATDSTVVSGSSRSASLTHFGALTLGTPVTITVNATTALGTSPDATTTTQVLPVGVTDASVGTGPSPAAQSTTAIGGTTYTYGAAATGTGTVVVSHYGANANPTGVVLHGTSTPLFDVFIAPGSSLSTVTITSCPVLGKGVLTWFDPSAKTWTPVAPAATTVSGCLSFTATTTSTPNVSQLTGSVFGVVDAPATGTVTADATDVVSGGSTVIHVHADTASSGPAQGAQISLSDGQSAVADTNGNATFTVSHSSPATVHYSADANGVAMGSVAVTYWDAPTVTTTSLPIGTAGSSYSATVSGTGGDPTVTYSATGLPTGLGISSAGAISGTTSATGNFTVVVTATDSLSQTGTANLTLSVDAVPTINTTSLPDAISGTSYNATLAAGGGRSPFTWTASGLPAGLSISSSGVISGSTTVTGAAAVTFTATDSLGRAVSKTLTLTVYSQPTVTTTSLPTATASSAYAVTLAAAGGKAGYTWTVAGLPTGLTVSTAGVISGSTTSAGSFPLTVTVTDALGQTASSSLTLVVNAASPPPVGADLGLTVTSSRFIANEDSDLRVRVTNTGTVAAPGPITFTTNLPFGVTFAGATGSGWRCVSVAGLTGQKVTCTLPAGLGSGRSSSLTIGVRVRVPAGTTVSISSNVSFPGTDPTPADNSVTVTGVVRRG